MLAAMGACTASLAPADQLVTACLNGDLRSAKAAVGKGASVSEKGKYRHGSPWLPLHAAVCRRQRRVVVWLLSLGADPNADGVMYSGAWDSAACILQLLIDAGGNFNDDSSGRALIFLVAEGNNDDVLRVLLAQPSLDLTVTYQRKTPEEYTRDNECVKPALANMIALEVSRGCLLCTCLEGASDRTQVCSHSMLVCSLCWHCCDWQVGRRAVLVRSLRVRVLTPVVV